MFGIYTNTHRRITAVGISPITWRPNAEAFKNSSLAAAGKLRYLEPTAAKENQTLAKYMDFAQGIGAHRMVLVFCVRSNARYTPICKRGLRANFAALAKLRACSPFAPSRNLLVRTCGADH